MDTSVEDRFWEKVDRSGSCWLWIGAIKSNGYGVLHVGDKMKHAHRISWEMHKGEIPDGLQVDHLCRTRECVNPGHMELVTSRENTLRGVGVSAMAARRTACVNGHPFAGEHLGIRIRSGGAKERRCVTCDRIRRANRTKR